VRVREASKSKNAASRARVCRVYWCSAGRSCKSDDASINGTREASPPDGEPLSAAAVVLPLDMEVEQRAIEAHFRLSKRNLLTPVRGTRNVNQSWRFFGSKFIRSFGPKRAPIIFYIYLLCSVPGPMSIEMF